MTRAAAIGLVLTSAALAAVAMVVIAAWLATADQDDDAALDAEWWADDDGVDPDDDDVDPVDLTVEFPAIEAYPSKHHADTVRPVGDWYHPLYNREFGRVLDGDARWMVNA